MSQDSINKTLFDRAVLSEFHVNRPSVFVWRRILHCVRCKTATDHLVRSYLWHGPIVICVECGAYRNDGVLRRRRASDADVAKVARERWSTAGDLADFKAWLSAWFEEVEA